MEPLKAPPPPLIVLGGERWPWLNSVRSGRISVQWQVEGLSQRLAFPSLEKVGHFLEPPDSSRGKLCVASVIDSHLRLSNFATLCIPTSLSCPVVGRGITRGDPSGETDCSLWNSQSGLVPMHQGALCVCPAQA
jgi:hypothetical protein